MSTEKPQTPQAVWAELARLPKGEARAALLQDDDVRNLILNTGSFIVLSTGTVNEAGKTFQEKLASARVLQTHRLRTVNDTVILDGRGNFGGLSERSWPEENLAASIKINLKDLLNKTIDQCIDEIIRPQLLAIVNLRDDLTMDPQNRIIQVEESDELSRTAAAREMAEEGIDELGLDLLQFSRQLGVTREEIRVIFNAAALAKIPLRHVRDDNFAINIWDGDMKRPAYAVSPVGYLRSLDEDVFNLITIQGKARLIERSELIKKDTDALKGMEILGVEDVFLFDALKQWGRKTPEGARDLSYDYRYPHEWMGAWRQAQQVLAGSLDEKEVSNMMMELAREVQKSAIADAEASGATPYNINLAGALVQMNGNMIGQWEDLNKFDRDFGLPEGTFIAMHTAMEDVLVASGYKPSSPLADYRPSGATGPDSPAP